MGLGAALGRLSPSADAAAVTQQQKTESGLDEPPPPKLLMAQPSVAVPPPLGTAALLLWLAVAAAPPIFAALLGVLARYLETRTEPNFPPLRLTVVVILLSVPVMLAVHTLPTALARYLRRRRTHRRGSSGGGSSNGGSSSASLPGLAAELEGEPPPAPPSAVAGLARVPTLPGLSRVYARHPARHRRAVLLAVASSYTLVIVLLNAAPKLVDPPVVMLVSMFTVLGVALVGWLWLKAPLPRALLPAAALMIGGCAMVLVPNILDGAGQPGSLTTGRGWLGFGASVGALLGTVVYLVLLQAFRNVDPAMDAFEVYWWLTGVVLAVVLPLSLGIDGPGWAPQFRGMDGADWAALLFSACVAHIGSVVGIQLSTWKLGAPTVSMFFGLRLITSVLGSKVILGATIVRSGLQVAGVALVASAITAYMGLQWWEARRRRAAAVAARAGGSRDAAGSV